MCICTCIFHIYIFTYIYLHIYVYLFMLISYICTYLYIYINLQLGKTEVVSHNLNPVWPCICLKLKKKRDVLIECFDYDFGRKDDLIGEVCCSVLQRVAACCSVLQSVVVRSCCRDVLNEFYGLRFRKKSRPYWRGVLQCEAMCFIVLQCFSVCCIVFRGHCVQ